MEVTAGQPAIQVGGSGFGGFGGDAGLLFLGLMMMGMSGGWGGFQNRGPVQALTGDQAPVSSAQFQNGMNMQNLSDQNRDIIDNVNRVYHDTAGVVHDKYEEIQRDTAALAVGQANNLAKINECCCTTQRTIDAQTLRQTEQNAALQALVISENQKTRDMFQQSEIQRLRDALDNERERRRDDIAELRAQMRDMYTVKMPNQFTYNAGPGPFNQNPPMPPLPFPVMA